MLGSSSGTGRPANAAPGARTYTISATTPAIRNESFIESVPPRNGTTDLLCAPAIALDYKGGRTTEQRQPRGTHIRVELRHCETREGCSGCENEYHQRHNPSDSQRIFHRIHPPRTARMIERIDLVISNPLLLTDSGAGSDVVRRKSLAKG